MGNYTLKELCKKCGVTRRAVQGYEKAGLIFSCGRTSRGYLLYDEQTVLRAKQIKKLQNYGFSIAEIKRYCLSNKRERETLLTEKCFQLKKKCLQIISYINEIQEELNMMK